jgi:phosphopantetheine--protein transferase-like protein
MRIGIDIVDIDHFKKQIINSKGFLARLLTEEETKNENIETWAGRVAVKEALLKTGLLIPGQWLKAVIKSGKNGEPVLSGFDNQTLSKIHISISHIKKIAVAVVIYEK